MQAVAAMSGPMAGHWRRRAGHPRVQTVPVQMTFSGPVWFWKGPSPWYFVTVPDDQAAVIASVAGAVSYGWGMIPVRVRIGGTQWATAMFPKDGSYVLPIRASVRASEGLMTGTAVDVHLVIDA